MEKLWQYELSQTHWFLFDLGPWLDSLKAKISTYLQVDSSNYDFSHLCILTKVTIVDRPGW